jgi:hypothetical protein
LGRSAGRRLEPHAGFPQVRLREGGHPRFAIWTSGLPA